MSLGRIILSSALLIMPSIHNLALAQTSLDYKRLVEKATQQFSEYKKKTVEETKSALEELDIKLNEALSKMDEHSSNAKIAFSISAGAAITLFAYITHYNWVTRGVDPGPSFLSSLLGMISVGTSAYVGYSEYEQFEISKDDAKRLQLEIIALRAHLTEKLESKIENN